MVPKVGSDPFREALSILLHGCMNETRLDSSETAKDVKQVLENFCMERHKYKLNTWEPLKFIILHSNKTDKIHALLRLI